MISHTVAEAAHRILAAQFGGEAAGFTREQAERMRAADTVDWQQALRFAKAALRGIVPDSAL